MLVYRGILIYRFKSFKYRIFPVEAEIVSEVGGAKPLKYE
jgi:hypothetical protein